MVRNNSSTLLEALESLPLPLSFAQIQLLSEAIPIIMLAFTSDLDGANERLKNDLGICRSCTTPSPS